jgi:hypothetical protein
MLTISTNQSLARALILTASFPWGYQRMQPYSLGLAGSANDGYVNEEELCLPKMKTKFYEIVETEILLII